MAVQYVTHEGARGRQASAVRGLRCAAGLAGTGTGGEPDRARGPGDA